MIKINKDKIEEDDGFREYALKEAYDVKKQYVQLGMIVLGFIITTLLIESTIKWISVVATIGIIALVVYSLVWLKRLIGPVFIW